MFTFLTLLGHGKKGRKNTVEEYKIREKLLNFSKPPELSNFVQGFELSFFVQGLIKSIKETPDDWKRLTFSSTAYENNITNLYIAYEIPHEYNHGNMYFHMSDGLDKNLTLYEKEQLVKTIKKYLVERDDMKYKKELSDRQKYITDYFEKLIS